MKPLHLLRLLWVVALSAAAFGGAVAEPAPSPDAPKPLVYVLPIRGKIELALLYVVRRGAAEARQQNAVAMVLVMNTPGGRLDVTREIIQIVQRLGIPTYTFVERDAFSGGAFIALATDRIYMAPGGVIGAATPMLMSPTGGVPEQSEALEEKMISAGAAQIRAAAEQGGGELNAEERKFRAKLAEAMVRREVEIRIGNEVVSPEGQLLTLTSEEAARVYPGRDRPLLSSGTVPDLAAMLDAIGLAHAEQRKLQVTGAERVARFIAALAPLLLILGGLGLYLEFRTPGFGLPGIAGILALALFFWGHHIAGLAVSHEALLFLLGAALLAVELLFLPGFGLVGLAGSVLMMLGLLLAMVYRLPGSPFLPSWPDLQFPLMNLSLSLVGTAVLGAALGRFLPQSVMFRRLTLEAATDRQSGYTASADTSFLCGQRGAAVTDLRPAGVAKVGGHRVDVITRGEFIESGSPIRVAEARGAHVLVERDREAV